MFRNIRIKTKVIILSIFIFTLLMGISTFVSTTISFDIILDRIVSREAPASANYIAEVFEKKIAKAISLAKIIGDNPFVYEWLQKNRSEETTATITDYSKKFMEEGLSITFIVSNKTLDFYTQDGFFKTLSKDVARDSWYFDSVSSGQKVAINIQPSETNDELTAYVNVIIGDVTRPLGVAGVGISLTEVSRELADFKVSESSVAYLITEKGEIKAHPDKKYITEVGNIQSISDPGYKEKVVDELLREDSGILEYKDKDGDTKILSFASIPSAGWKIVIEAPEKELGKGLNKIVVTNAMVLVGFVLLIILVFDFMMRVILRPINETVSTLEDISEGEGNLTKRIKVSSRDEAGLLSLSFNKFVNKLQQMIKRIAEHTDFVSNSSGDLADIATTLVENSQETSQNSKKAAVAAEDMSNSIGAIATTLQIASDNVSQRLRLWGTQ